MNENLEALVKELRRKKAVAAGGGGKTSVERQHKNGRCTARERIEHLLDPGSFVEMKMLASLDEDSANGLYGDGVVSGYGKIDNRTVCIYSQDYTVKAGTTGPLHRSKITGAIDMAIKTGCPVIGLWDSAGGRLDLENKPLPLCNSSIFFRCTQASGLVPHISAILGPGAGNAGYAAALTDFIFMVDKQSYTFATGPAGVKEVLGEEISMEALGGAKVHCQTSGLADGRFVTEDECFAQIRALLSYLPSSWKKPSPRGPVDENYREPDDEIGDLVPANLLKGYDMKRIIARVVDRGEFFEIKPEFAKNIITCFGRLNGMSVGIVANQTLCMAGSLTVNSSDKEARFIRFCDAFNIPLIFFTDTTGFLPGSQQEHAGILRHGAKVLYAISESVVPKIAVLVRKAYGGAKPAMGIDKDIGVDHIYAWPTGESAIMGAEGVANVIYGREIAQSKNPEELREQRIKELKKAANPYPMAYGGLVDDIIEPAETRRRLIETLEAISEKEMVMPSKRHGNIPL